MLRKLVLLCSLAFLLGCNQKEKESAIDIKKSEAASLAFYDSGVPAAQIRVVDRS